MRCPQSSRGSGPSILPLTPDFCTAALCSSLLGTVFALVEVHGSGDRLVVKRWASERARQALQLSSPWFLCASPEGCD